MAVGPAVEACGLTVAYRARPGYVNALASVNFRIARGELLVVLGPSGCGKTTLLRALAGSLSASAGTIRICGVSPTEARARRLLGMVWQFPTLLPNRDARRNVALPLEIAGIHDSKRVDRALSLVGLDGHGQFYPSQLSGGMQQRVAVARALVLSPAVLLMDEPFSALDELRREQLASDFLALQRELRQTVVFVTHSVEEAAFLADRVLVLSDRPGTVRHLVEVGAPDPSAAVRRSDRFFAKVAQMRALLQSSETI